MLPEDGVETVSRRVASAVDVSATIYSLRSVSKSSDSATVMVGCIEGSWLSELSWAFSPSESSRDEMLDCSVAISDSISFVAFQLNKSRRVSTLAGTIDSLEREEDKVDMLGDTYSLSES